MGGWWKGLGSQTRTVIRLVCLLSVMTSLTVAAVPFYSWFCRVTGYGGETNVSAGNDKGVLEQTVKVRFDANVERGFPWSFKPETREMEIRIGETGLAFYEATNNTARSPGRRPTTSRRSRRATTSPRSTASASPTRCCSRASPS